MKAPENLIKCGRDLIENKLTWGNSGNVSVKVESDAFLISAGGTNLGSLQMEDIIRCEIDKEAYQGNGTPSMETGLHRAIYQACNKSEAIIHSQPVYSTIAACSDMPIQTDFLPEAMAYLENVVRIPYHHAGSQELAQATSEQSPNSQILILNNHGIVCWGHSLDEALLLTQTLEFCCRLSITAPSAGLNLNYLGNDTIKSFRRHLKSIGR